MHTTIEKVLRGRLFDSQQGAIIDDDGNNESQVHLSDALSSTWGLEKHRANHQPYRAVSSHGYGSMLADLISRRNECSVAIGSRTHLVKDSLHLHTCWRGHRKENQLIMSPRL